MTRHLIPTITVKPVGAVWCVHVTYADGTTHVPAYYRTRGWASYVAGYLHGCYENAPPTHPVESQVRTTLLAIHTLGGQLQPLEGDAPALPVKGGGTTAPRPGALA